MFAMDHFHYARLLTVHVRDLMQLKDKIPSIYEELRRGNLVTHKTPHKFSAMAHDQIHEQLNAMIKGDGGVIGITENEAALERWMVSSPEIGRMLNEYEIKHSKKKTDSERHHEQIPSIQKAFATKVKQTVSVINEMGNPFNDDSTAYFRHKDHHVQGSHQSS